ncbi:MAG: hypothetical protein COT74_12450 [Bdellovibrionales bacterium CG10_big_fil_rev_8_21_14_0_10_45_34]|nr:MAG: hypothetical protein COT74_12450 [Bdellovibrionales bacterium CG10_big_fil_rev_8_21_14_0_10_45_34]
MLVLIRFFGAFSNLIGYRNCFTFLIAGSVLVAPSLSLSEENQSLKYIGFSSNPKIGFSFGTSHFTLESEYFVENQPSYHRSGFDFSVRTAGFVGQLNYYFEKAFEGFFAGIHSGSVEVTERDGFGTSADPSFTGFTRSPSESLIGAQVGYMFIWQNGIALGVSVRGTYYGQEIYSLIYAPIVSLGVVF